MSNRYFHLDVAFLHKQTCATLRAELGPQAPLVFIALIAQAKTSNPPGTFTFENDALGWERLGFTGWVPDFTLREFFQVTGKMKQTSITCRARKQSGHRRDDCGTLPGHCQDVVLTRYSEWQKDGIRQSERVRKSRYRAQKGRDTERDTSGTPDGTATGQEVGRRTRPRSIPLPPNGKVKCPRCSYMAPNSDDLEGHLEDNHGVFPHGHPEGAAA